MIKIITGGKKNANWALTACAEYEKRLKKPYDISWQFLDEEKLAAYLAKWPFGGKDYVIVCDERGQNISSPEFSKRLEKCFLANQNVVILIGGAYGFAESVREKADFIWSFSQLVFPHLIARLIVTEQIYRAAEISKGGPYHHE
ncbi:23S rRNA (pseudouridine(1915)-N(3))-methyltransferase RlmH [Candidatus Saccharibacteria bacterium]|nr:23S rRNA (pseudouridine(1915)-N(3))-methyltransferase RlmH [Candidatus Saccharibacteria bacterium]